MVLMLPYTAKALLPVLDNAVPWAEKALNAAAFGTVKERFFHRWNQAASYLIKVLVCRLIRGWLMPVTILKCY